MRLTQPQDLIKLLLCRSSPPNKTPFRSGAMVAQTAVNRKVTGSNPVSGAKY